MSSLLIAYFSGLAFEIEKFESANISAKQDDGTYHLDIEVLPDSEITGYYPSFEAADAVLKEIVTAYHTVARVRRLVKEATLTDEDASPILAAIAKGVKMPPSDVERELERSTRCSII